MDVAVSNFYIDLLFKFIVSKILTKIVSVRCHLACPVIIVVHIARNMLVFTEIPLVCCAICVKLL